MIPLYHTFLFQASLLYRRKLALIQFSIKSILRKQFLMMKLVLAFYDESRKALENGANVQGLIKMAVREKIGRFKYVTDDEIEREYEAVKEELGKEIDDVLRREDF